MITCPAIPVTEGFISSLTSHIDCQVHSLGFGAWDALAAPGSTLSLVLSGFLTIFVALLGYKLMLGDQLTVRSGTIACVKIGAILALATSWPAYRTLVYDVVTVGPSQLVGEIGPSAALPGSDGTLPQRLDIADDELARLAILGAGGSPSDSESQIAPPPFGGFEPFAFGGSRILFELTAVASLSIVRVITGLMVGLGPFFIAFLMFDSTRGLFEGWIRVLAGTALATIGVSVALGMELALIEPWLADVLSRRLSGEAMPSVPSELLVIVCLFSIMVAAAINGSARVARAFKLAPLPSFFAIGSHEVPRGALPVPASMPQIGASAGTEHTRIATITSAILATARRERTRLAAREGVSVNRERGSSHSSSDFGQYPATPIGRSFTRRPHAQLSALAAKRDRRG